MRQVMPKYDYFFFTAPEILNKETVNEAADMWGLGALTYVMLVSSPVVVCFYLFLIHLQT